MRRYSILITDLCLGIVKLKTGEEIDIDHFVSLLQRAVDEIIRLKDVTDHLPRTADGEIAVEGAEVYTSSSDEVTYIQPPIVETRVTFITDDGQTVIDDVKKYYSRKPEEDHKSS